jgi:hypothetical protein
VYLLMAVVVVVVEPMDQNEYSDIEVVAKIDKS